MKISIIGAGSWGTALGKVLAEKGFEVWLLARREEVAESINIDGENLQYLPGIKLPPKLKATTDPAFALKDSELVIWTIPSYALRENLEKLKDYVGPVIHHLSGIKGIDLESGKRPLEIFREVLGANRNYYVLGGPSFALEVAKGLPTAVVIAGSNAEQTRYVQELIAWKYFRVYRSYDPVGVELAGALKNVIAIATGICDGLGLGQNARAGLIARGLMEMVRCGVRLGGKRETFYGLAGLGDLVLTCTGALSRNYQIGYKIALGRTLDEALKEVKQVAEGVKTVLTIKKLSEKEGIDLPICEQVYEILYCGEKPENSIEKILSRALKEEFENF